MNWKQRVKGVLGRLLYVFIGAIVATLVIATTLSINLDAQKFGHIISIIQEGSIYASDDAIGEKLYEIAVESVLREIGDKHAAYLSAEEYSLMQQDDSPVPYTGIGIGVLWHKEGNIKGLFIEEVFDGPAKEAGLKVKDIITKIEGQSYDSIDQYVNRIRGPAGTFVTITIRRNGTELGDLTLERDYATRQNVTSAILPDGVIYVRLKQFISTSTEEIESHIESRIAELEMQNIEPIGLIIDGRYNPGGLLTQAHEVTDLFIPKGKKTVITDGRSDEMDMEFVAEREPLFPENFPIVILVNDYCASACEILAGATKRHRVAKIVGIPTYGKGSVQSFVPLYDGSALKLTTALYFAGGDVPVDGNPITPDFDVGNPEKTRDEVVEHRLLINSLDLENDEQLAKAHWWILFADGINPGWRYNAIGGPHL
jgi:carboxyl-terminal processing protease